VAARRKPAQVTPEETPEQIPEDLEPKVSDIWEPKERPVCPNCGNRMNKKGHQVSRKLPHKCRTYQCTECGTSITPRPTEKETQQLE